MDSTHTTKTAKKREAILEIAMKLFLEKGYSATSTSDICTSANINKPTLYYYFKSKLHLLFSLHIKSLEEILKPYLEKAATIRDPMQRLGFMIKEYTELICTHPELRILIHESLNIQDDLFTEVRQEWKKHYLLIRDTLGELQALGKASSSYNPSWLALLLLGMMTWITYWLDYERKDQVDDIAELAMGFILSGIKANEDGALG